MGETSEEAVSRELREEMNIDLPEKPILFGVYGDPKRDARRHTTSVVYIVDIPEHIVPHAGDDATDVHRVALDDISQREFFIDVSCNTHHYRVLPVFHSTDNFITIREPFTKQFI